MSSQSAGVYLACALWFALGVILGADGRPLVGGPAPADPGIVMLDHNLKPEYLKLPEGTTMSSDGRVKFPERENIEVDGAYAGWANEQDSTFWTTSALISATEVNGDTWGFMVDGDEVKAHGCYTTQDGKRFCWVHTFKVGEEVTLPDGRKVTVE